MCDYFTTLIQRMPGVIKADLNGVKFTLVFTLSKFFTILYRKLRAVASNQNWKQQFN